MHNTFTQSENWNKLYKCIIKYTGDKIAVDDSKSIFEPFGQNARFLTCYSLGFIVNLYIFFSLLLFGIILGPKAE